VTLDAQWEIYISFVFDFAYNFDYVQLWPFLSGLDRKSNLYFMCMYLDLDNNQQDTKPVCVPRARPGL